MKRVQKSDPCDPASNEAIAAFRQRIASSRAARVERIRATSTSDPVQAYREATAFVTAFVDAPERTEVNDLKLFGDTAYAKVAEAAVTAHGEAIRNPN